MRRRFLSSPQSERLPGRLEPVLVVRACQVCGRAGGEHVAGDGREDAGLFVGDDTWTTASTPSLEAIGCRWTEGRRTVVSSEVEEKSPGRALVRRGRVPDCDF
jgi:hypothetical protein